MVTCACSINVHTCQATAEACAAAFRVPWHRERQNSLLRKTIDVDIAGESTREQSDVEQSDSEQALGGHGKRQRPLAADAYESLGPPELNVLAGRVTEMLPTGGLQAE